MRTGTSCAPARCHERSSNEATRRPWRSWTAKVTAPSSVARPYAVDLQPVLKVDGCPVARGTGARMAGAFQNSDLEFLPPTEAPQVVTLVQNAILAGDYQGVGLDPGAVRPALLGGVTTSCPEDYLGQAVHQAVLTYLNNVDSATDSLAALMHLTLTRDVSETLVENALTVATLMGLPFSWQWEGMVVDADRRVTGCTRCTGTACSGTSSGSGAPRPRCRSIGCSRRCSAKKRSRP